ncbi:MAG TPA: hypothetical protein VN228_11160, partial [Pyrinomonadaceae bacterium]|nr:hypothetical protein [Pyrinomonadaceae bacterium]
AVDYHRPFPPSEVSQRARIISKPEPGFTEEARRENVTGVVRLKAVFSASGRGAAATPAAATGGRAAAAPAGAAARGSTTRGRSRRAR